MNLNSVLCYSSQFLCYVAPAEDGLDEKTYLLLVLTYEDVLIVDHHSLQEIFRTGHVLCFKSLAVLLLPLLDLFRIHSLATKYGRLARSMNSVLRL